MTYMRRFGFFLTVLCTLATIPNYGQSSKNQAILKVAFAGIEPKGQLLIAVYNSAKSMESDAAEAAVAKQKVDAKPGATANFGLQPGRYAIMVVHDVNGNGKLDKNIVGIPKEPIGVSNGLKSKLRRPTFAECSFDLSAPGKTVTLQLERF